LMVEAGVLQQVLPEATNLDRLAGLVALSASVDDARDRVLRLAALLPDAPAALEEIGTRLRLANAERDRIAAALGEPALSPALDPHARRVRLYRAGVQPFRDRALLDWATQADPADTAWRTLAGLPESWPPPRFPLSGKDALAAGMKAGPAMGAALKAA